MIDVKTLTEGERSAMAVDFHEHFNGAEEISRDNFDIKIIDMGLAEDPGTTDTKSAAHKGFVQQRNAARKFLNNAAAKLPEDRAFKIEPIGANAATYRIAGWANASYAEAADIGNRVELFTKNKVRHVGKIRADLVGKVIDGEQLDSLMQMVGQVEGYGLVMQRNVRNEVAKFNRAIEMVEAEAERLRLESA